MKSLNGLNKWRKVRPERETDDAIQQIVANAKRLKQQIGVRNFRSLVSSPRINSEPSDDQAKSRPKNGLQPAVFKLTPTFVTRKRPLIAQNEVKEEIRKPKRAHQQPDLKTQKQRLLHELQDGRFGEQTPVSIKEEPLNHDNSNLTDLAVPSYSQAEAMFIDKCTAVSVPEKFIHNSIFWQYRNFPHLK